MTERHEVRGLLMAGGRSKRMGRDKRFLDIGNQPMILHAYRALERAFGAPWVLVANEGDVAELSSLLGKNARFLLDMSPSGGPLAAVADALAILDRPFGFLLATDMPGVDAEFLMKFDEVRLRLGDRPDAIVATSAGHVQVMCGFYRREIVAAIWEAMREGSRCLADTLARPGVRTHYLDESEKEALGGDAVFQNLNTPVDYERYMRECHGT